jgi:hypothetical protein
MNTFVTMPHRSIDLQRFQSTTNLLAARAAYCSNTIYRSYWKKPTSGSGTVLNSVAERETERNIEAREMAKRVLRAIKQSPLERFHRARTATGLADVVGAFGSREWIQVFVGRQSFADEDARLTGGVGKGFPTYRAARL